MQSRKDFLQNSGITFAGILLSNELSALTNTTNNNSSGYKITFAGKQANNNGLLPKFDSSHEIVFDETKAVLLNNLRCEKTGSDKIVINTEDFAIVQQGNMKIGIVTVADKAEMKKTDEIASMLKSDKGCTVVVCVSSLGFKNENNVDDVTLASSSTYIDTILSANKANYCSFQYVAKNNNKSEVFIINNIDDNKPQNSVVSIRLDKNGTRQAVAFC